MGRPRLIRYDLLTTGQVAKELGISKTCLLYRLKKVVTIDGVEKRYYPPPTKVEKNGNRYFSREWLRKVKGNGN